MHRLIALKAAVQAQNDLWDRLNDLEVALGYEGHGHTDDDVSDYIFDHVKQLASGGDADRVTVNEVVDLESMP